MEEMSDLISREALKEATKELYNETLDAIVKFGIEKVYELINNATTVEPKQGEWKQLDNQIYCNLCNRTSFSESNFCPNCGAQMRKGGAE